MKDSFYISECNSNGEYQERIVGLSEYKEWLRKNSTLTGKTLEQYIDYQVRLGKKISDTMRVR
jgi:hypothetical protein